VTDVSWREGAQAMNDTDRIRDALSYLDPAMSRDDWVKVGMAIKSELGEEGFGLWDDWSRGADCYDARCARDTWRSCKPNGGVTGGSLFYMARSCGWRNNGQKPTPEEIEARRREAAERAAKEKARKAREHAQAARRAGEIWEAATPAQADHPYLVRKRISPTVGLREMEAQTVAEILGYAPKQGDEPLVGRLLVVPVKVAGDLSTLEHIDETGRKSALSRGKKSGGYWDAQELPEGDGTGITILVGEGVATTLSAREATGHLAVAALTSGNLLAVAREMRQRYPKAVLVVLADLVKTTGEPDPHAIEAARAVGGKQVVPKFPEPRDPEHTDMNDLAAA
jgi:putative DNA primase/helicase